MISGYLTAFKELGREVSRGSGELKTINMGIYYLIMVSQEPIFMVGVADKRDDKNIVHHSLSKLLTHFITTFKSELEEWGGNIALFREFKEKINELFGDGKIGEVEFRIPILKSYKKSFLKYRNEMITMKLLSNTDDFAAFIEAHRKPSWVSEKRLPIQTISQGFFTKESYRIAHKFDGLHTVEEVSEETGLNEKEIKVILKSLEDSGLLDFIDII